MLTQLLCFMVGPASVLMLAYDKRHLTSGWQLRVYSIHPLDP